MQICEIINECKFHNKYQHAQQLECRGFINSYCFGPKMKECARLQYLKTKNEQPVADMLPSGKIIECGDTMEPYKKSDQKYY